MTADADRGPSRNLLRAFVLAGGWIVVVTETLSLVNGITQAALAAAWLLPSLGLAAWLVAHRRGIREIRLKLADALPATRGEWALTCGVTAILGVTALVAFFAPPQTWDSLNYHMSRVAHWAENASVEPFATGIETQNSRSPGAEFAVLHLYVLAGSDRWVNFVAWGSVAGMVIAAWVLARQAGATREARILTAVYVVSLPMGIVQASSTMTDAVAALWVGAAATEVIGLPNEGPPWARAAWAGLAAALAVLTKPTTVPFLIPLAVWAAARLARRHGWRSALGGTVMAATLVVAVNAGHWTRSYLLYGDPISGGDQVEVHANQAFGLDGQISNVLRNAALQLGTPSPHVNRAIALTILEIHRLLGISPDDPRTTSHGYFKVEEPTTRENTAGNPVQAYLGLIGLGAVFLRRDSSKTLKAISLAAVTGFWLFSALFKWQIFGSRYHLPFFVLLAPAAGIGVSRLIGPRWTAWIAAAMLVLSLPWLLTIRSRPLVPVPGSSLVGSVLAEPRSRLLLANGLYLAAPYQEMTDLIQDAACRRIGLALGGNSAEYPLWALLGSTEGDRRIEWIVEGTPSSRWLPASFEPCAVICEGCEGEAVFRGLPRAYDRYGFVLFLDSPND